MDEAYQDLEFRAGVGQWDEKVRRQREGADRPCLTVNRCPQFVNQVTGDMRQMNPTFKVVGVNDQDKDKVDAINQLLRHITYNSVASDAFFYAADSQVTAGIGHWRVVTEYANDDGEDQEIRIERVDDGVGVVWDPDSTRSDRSDAKWCFVPVDLSMDVFKERYPNAKTSGFRDIDEYRRSTSDDTWWAPSDSVRVAEYWIKEIDDDEAAEAGEGEGKRKRQKVKVCKYIVSHDEILDGPIYWGVSDSKPSAKHIPIVPLIGEEVRIGNKTIRHGKIRFIKDAQRRLNYFTSAHAEVVALQPKAPFIAAEGQLDAYVDQWSRANVDNLPALIYKPVPGAPTPQRSQPPVSSSGIAEGIALAAEDMKAVTGMYDSSLGARSNETSSIAIRARDQQSDTGTYVYIENFKRALEHTGRIILEVMPHVYDTERVLQIIGDDGAVNEVEINRSVLMGGMPFIKNDLTVGKFDLRVETGPSYSTKRQESKDGMMQFLQSNPNVSPVIADLVAKSQDWPLSDKIAERLKLMLPPPILAMERQEEGGQHGGQMPVPQQAPEPSPQEQMAMQMEMQAKQADLAIKQADVQIKGADLEIKQAQAVKAKADAEKAQMETASLGVQMHAALQDPRVDVLAQHVDALGQAISQIMAMISPPQPETMPQEYAQNYGQEMQMPHRL